VRWTADQMLRKIVPDGGEPLWRDPSGRIVLAEVGFTPAWIGEQVKSVEASTTSRIAFVDRLGQAFVPEPGTVLQEGDVLHVVARESDMDRIRASFATRGGGH
jgi:trk system potassium uptake protein TrkA